ncbi:MAG: pre-peptidase C-terminal domain-containing protein [Promethearchaeota archaeon]
MKNIKKIEYAVYATVLVICLSSIIPYGFIKVNPTDTSIQENQLRTSAVAFFDDFESGLTQWVSITGLWHLTDTGSSWSNPCHSPTHSMWFGNESTGNYDTGYWEYGEMVSTSFSLVGFTIATLDFYHWREGEGDTWDMSFVDISTDGTNWYNIYSSDANYIAPWQHIFLDLSGYIGYSTVQLRFRFDTFDDIANDYRGWLVDDIQVSDTPIPDDNYEENDAYTTAYDLSLYENTWLSTIDGLGVQFDEDWYEIYVDPGDLNLQVDLTFSNSAGDIDIEVYASDGITLVAGSYSVTDNEYIDVIVPSAGTYYLYIYGPNAGNQYDLWWDDLYPIPDDNYEQNDDYSTAYDLSAYEDTWLSTIDGLGIQADDDWYEIYVDPGDLNLQVELLFTDSEGDIDIDVYDSSITWIAGGGSATDNEYIDVIVPSAGTYYLLIYYDNAGNTYDLWWDDLYPIPDDNYEQNDDYSTAYDLSAYEDTWLSTIDGLGIQADDDWYEIYVDPGDLNLQVVLTFSHSAGDIDIVVYDGSLSFIAGNWSITDNEYIDVIVPSAGTYYFFIFGPNGGNTYDLWWDDLPPPPDDNYEENDDETEPYDLSGYEDTWLSTINGPGIQADDDWYEIYVDPGELNVQVSLIFTHANGDLRLYLVNSSLTWYVFSDSTTDNESINTYVSSAGYYYILILGDDLGNQYDLWWDDFVGVPPPDDNYEENDDPDSAYNLSSYEATWLSSIDGLGIQGDNDFYEIYVDSGDEHLMVTLTFTHDDGNIDIQIRDSSFSWVVYNDSMTDNEYIDVIVPSAGTYYLIIYGFNAYNEYDLWWDDLSSTDDNYEENDAYTTAFDFSANINVWLSTVDGTGVQFDDDWYEIYVGPGYEQLIVDLTFSHTADNLDLGIYDSSGTLITESTSTTDNEHIDYVLPSFGTYCIRVYGNDIGNEYDLRWNTLIPDDNYEENDDLDSAYVLSEDTLLNGVQLDDDWYEISIAEGYENLTIILTFIHSSGNIDLALYNSSGDLLVSSTSSTDNEYLNLIVSSSGVFYIRVYGDNSGNSYSLTWSSIEYTPPGGGPPAIPGYDLLFLLGIIFIISTITIRRLIKRKLRLEEN